MKVIVSKDEDADALLNKLRLEERKLLERFGQQSTEQRHATYETAKGMLTVMVDWLHAQGFKLP